MELEIQRLVESGKAQQAVPLARTYMSIIDRVFGVA
jgi:hypothetical protein